MSIPETLFSAIDSRLGPDLKIIYDDYIIGPDSFHRAYFSSEIIPRLRRSLSPLQFWFNTDPGLAIPLCAIPFQTEDLYSEPIKFSFNYELIFETTDLS